MRLRRGGGEGLLVQDHKRCLGSVRRRNVHLIALSRGKDPLVGKGGGWFSGANSSKRRLRSSRGMAHGGGRRGGGGDSRDEFRHTWRLRRDGTRRDNADIGPGKYGGKVRRVVDTERRRRRRWRRRKITPVDKLSGWGCILGSYQSPPQR